MDGIERDFCTEDDHDLGCPCRAGGEEILRPIEVGDTVRVTNPGSCFRGLEADVVRVVDSTLLVSYGPKIGHIGRLPFGRSEVEFVR